MSIRKTTRKFKAEVNELLDLIINSLYSNKEIFLRELISNSSDALDKLKFKAQTEPELLEGDAADFGITLRADPVARTLEVSDNGIGMTFDEVVENIGTIAKSGTALFTEALAALKEKKSSAPELIGQFGVGFYSAFMVADKITIITRAAGHTTAVKWESTGDGSYTVEEAERPGRGTSVIVHLKEKSEGDKDYCDEWTLRDIVKRHSDFVSYPIMMEVTRRVPVGGDGKTSPEKYEEQKVTDVLNSMKALWARPKAEISDEEYKEFYKHVSHDWTDPLSWLHVKLEGTTEFDALLYVPEKRPHDLFRPDAHHGVSLYSKRIFIMSDCKELLPTYLRFLRGVVDSSDLSLNVSREILQEDRVVQAIRKALVRRVLDHIAELPEEKFLAFYKEFGAVLKEGVHSDHQNRDRIAKMLRYQTSRSAGELVTLDKYVENMAEGQEHIYYLTGESIPSLAGSPHLEVLRKKGIEVLLMTDPIDEFVTEALGEYSGKSFRSAEKGDLELAGEEEPEKEKEYSGLVDLLKKALGDKVKGVRPSHRLEDSASCLCAEEQEMSALMLKMLKSTGQGFPEAKRTLEVNLGHPLLAGLKSVYEREPDSPKIAGYAQLLFELALVSEGTKVENPSDFARRVGELAAEALKTQ
jgi:molecular chaperone HtpG